MEEKKQVSRIRRELEMLVLSDANTIQQERLMEAENSEKILQTHREYVDMVNQAYKFLCEKYCIEYEKIKSCIGLNGKPVSNYKYKKEEQS